MLLRRMFGWICWSTHGNYTVWTKSTTWTTTSRPNGPMWSFHWYLMSLLLASHHVLCKPYKSNIRLCIMFTLIRTTQQRVRTSHATTLGLLSWFLSDGWWDNHEHQRLHGDANRATCSLGVSLIQHCLMIDVPTQIVPLPEVPTQALLMGQEISVDATQAQRHHFAHNTGCGKRAIARHA